MNQNVNKIKKLIKRDWQLYLFLFFPIAYILIFEYGPMGGLVIAFQDYSARKGILKSEWVGLAHFVTFFESYEFKRVLKNTIILSFYNIIAGFPIPVIFALMLNSLRSERFKKVTQTIVNMPHFISVTVLVGILLNVLNSRTGLYGTVGEALTGSYPFDLFSSPTAFRHIYVWSGVWQNFGWSSIIYVAALSNVDPQFHEAAQVDGASRLQRIIHIDLPCIIPTIVIQLILSVGRIMSIGFEKVFLLQNSLNIEASSIISTYVYNVGLAGAGRLNFSYAAAIGMFNSVVNLILITTVNRISRKVSETSLW